MVGISELVKLRYLDLSVSSVGDAGLKRLESLVDLEYLDVASTGVGPKSLAVLGRLKSLEHLFVGKMTDESSVHRQFLQIETEFGQVLETNPCDGFRSCRCSSCGAVA